MVNPFKKEYINGRKDQFDLDYALFRKSIEESSTREELIEFLQEKFDYIIAKIASERAKDLMEELELL